MLSKLAAMPSKKQGQLYANLGMLCSKLGTLCSKLGTLCSNHGMLQVFAGTPYEDKERIHEESRGHRAQHWVLSIVLTTPR
jgi:hypothetical protein